MDKKENTILHMFDFDRNGVLDPIEAATADTYMRSLHAKEEGDAFWDTEDDITFDHEDDFIDDEFED